MKDLGNKFFNDGEYLAAIRHYNRANDMYRLMEKQFPFYIGKVHEDMRTLQSNMSLAFLKDGHPHSAIRCANECINIDPGFYKVT